MKTTQQIFDEAIEIANKAVAATKPAEVKSPFHYDALFNLVVGALLKERDLEHQIELQKLYYVGIQTATRVQQLARESKVIKNVGEVSR